MIARTPAWIVAAAVFVAHQAGLIETAAQILTGIDKAATAVVDIRSTLRPKTATPPTRPAPRAARKHAHEPTVAYHPGSP